jgi:hypothetical protein
MTTLTNKIRDERLFFGGMNTDDDPRFLPEGDYIDAINVIKNEDGSNGILVNIKGNKNVFEKEVTYTSEFLCGWTYYDKNESVILFLFYNLGVIVGNRIVEYDPKSDTSTVIINNTILGFNNPSTDDYFIKADMLDDWLSWTDNEGEPKTINVQTIKDDSPTITLDYLTAIKKPPFIVPDGIFGYDDTIERSNIVGSFYKFKYRYTYEGFRKSVWSGAGKSLIHQNDISPNETLIYNDVDNYIDILFNSGSAEVNFLEFAMQNNDDNSWYKILVLDKSTPLNIYNASGTPISTIVDDTEYYFRFYNDSQYVVIDTSDIIRPNDFLPRKSESLSFITDNRLLYGGNTFGYDVDGLDVDIDFTVDTKATDSGAVVTGTFSYVNAGGNCTVKAAYDLTLLLPLGATTGDLILFYFNYPVTSVGSIRLNNVISFPYDAVSASDKFDYISSVINTVGWGDTTPADTAPNSTAVTLNGNNIEFTATWNGVSGTASGTTADNTYYLVTDDINSSFKLGINKKIGIVYYDSYGRKSPVLLGENSNVAFDDTGALISTGRTEVDFQINHNAPTWASYYRFAYVKNRQTFSNVYVYFDNYVYDSNGDLEDGLVALYLNSPNAENTTDINLDKQYVIEVGDRIRPFSLSTDSLLNYEKEYLVQDVRDIIYNSSGTAVNNYFIIIKSDDFIEGQTKVFSFFQSYFATISKGQKAISDDVFYEIGDFGLCNDSVPGDHVPSTGSLIEGDVWVRYRKQLISSIAFPTPIYTLTLMEEYYPSSNVEGILSNSDTVNIEDENYREQYSNTLQWSNKYFQDTQINGLSSFDFDSKVDVSDSYGNIKGLEELGKSIVVICEKKVFSGGVGYTEYLDAQGNINQIKSDSVIGYLRASDERYGTFLKESILNTGQYIYFFDLYNKAVIRKARNGLYPISGSSITPNGATNYKMRTYFSNLGNSLITSLSANDPKDVKVFMGYDVFYDSVYITFLDRINSANNVSLIFHEPSARWVSRYNSYHTSLSSTMFPFTDSFMMNYRENDGELYVYNDTSVDRCNLFGVQYDSTLRFISNKVANEVKIFNNISVHSNSLWHGDSDDAIIIPAKEAYREAGSYIFRDMSSKIYDGNWRLEDGLYRSEILRDGKTTSDTFKRIDAYNGNLMQGEFIDITLTNDNTDETKLFKISVDAELTK